MKLGKCWPVAVALLALATACSSPAGPPATPIGTTGQPAGPEAEQVPAASPGPPPAPQPPEIRISREQAIARMRADTNGSVAVSNARLIYFTTRGQEPVMFALWLVDLGDEKSPEGYAVIDATTGDVLNATNAHSGQ